MYSKLDALISQAATQAIKQHGTNAERALRDIIAANAACGDLQGVKIWTMIASRVLSKKSPGSLFTAGLVKAAAKQTHTNNKR